MACVKSAFYVKSVSEAAWRKGIKKAGYAQKTALPHLSQGVGEAHG
jgi:hypothetical protein